MTLQSYHSNKSQSTPENSQKTPQEKQSGARERARAFLLDKNGASRPKHEWDRQQKETYGLAMSWMRECKARNMQFLFCTLTSRKDGSGKYLNRDFKKLLKRIERKYHYDIEHFGVETSEGGGVYHVVLAIKSDKPLWIGKRWLAKTWNEVHGAFEVQIDSMGGSNKDMRNVAGYVVNQYMANQSLYVRRIWSWWKSRVRLRQGWALLKRAYYMQVRSANFHFGLSGVYMKYQDLLSAWCCLLDEHWCDMGGQRFMVVGREVMSAEDFYGVREEAESFCLSSSRMNLGLVRA